MRNIYRSHINNQKATPFETSEEAWFWYCLCEKNAKQRTKGYTPKTIRPCESSDIFIAVKRLATEGLLKPEHIKILSHYGFEQVPPHPHFGDTPRICRLWQEALHFLDKILSQKGIVSPGANA